MPFGQIEQGWFEDDLWSLHSIPPALAHHTVIEQKRQEPHLMESIDSIPKQIADVTGSSPPASTITQTPHPDEHHEIIVQIH